MMKETYIENWIEICLRIGRVESRETWEVELN